MYVKVNLQTVTVTVCFTSAAALVFINCSQTVKQGICRCIPQKSEERVAVREDRTKTLLASAKAHSPKSLKPTPHKEKVVSKAVVVITLATKTVSVVQANSILVRYPIAIGKTGWETPVGHYVIFEKAQNPSWKHPITGEVIPPSPQNPMGTRWIGFWQNAQGQKIGFHGTNNEASVGKAVSHGCLRMHNSDIQDLYDQVELGTTVIVQ